MPEKDDKPRGGPRPFWSGTITFGLVSLPVDLFAAARSSRVPLRMVTDEGTQLRRRYFCPKDERALDYDEIVRGYEVEKDRFVVVEDEELDSIAPDKSQEIDLRRFVAMSEIDPIYFERAYFLTPGKGAIKTYRLLATTMEEAGRAGIATFVMRGKECLVAIIAEKGILRAETLRFFEELRSSADVGLPEPEEPKAADVRQMEKDIRSLSAKQLDTKALEDRQRQAVLKRVRAKLKKNEDVVAAPEPEDDAEEDQEAGGDTQATDLMAALKESLEGGDGESRERTSKKKKKTRKKVGGAPADLERRPKAELYEQAQRLDIAGRSSMSKRELAEAIAGRN